MHTWLQGPLVDALFGQGSAAGLKPGLGELHGVDYIIGAVRIAQVWLVTCACMHAGSHARTHAVPWPPAARDREGVHHSAGVCKQLVYLRRAGQ